MVLRGCKILTTSLTMPELLEVNMHVNPVRVAYTLDDKTSCTGIYGNSTLTDMAEFWVIPGNTSLNLFSFGLVQDSSLSVRPGHTAPPSSPHEEAGPCYLRRIISGLDHIERNHGVVQAEEMIASGRFRRRNRVPA